MSEGSKGGWKLVFRDDELDTLKAALQHVIDQEDKALGLRAKELYPLELMAHRVCKARVEEILTYINSVTG